MRLPPGETNMKIRLICSSLILTAVSAGSVYAEPYKNTTGPYVGGSALFVDAKAEGSEDASLMAIGGRLGTQLNENFSGEVRVALGVGDDTVRYGIAEYDVELNSMIGGYLRVGAPIGANFHPYAIVGFTRTELEYSQNFLGDGSESDTDLSYGLGVDLDLDRNLSLNVEYMNYYDDDDIEVSGFSIGIASKI